MKLFIYPDSKLSKAAAPVEEFDRELHRKVQEANYIMSSLKLRSVSGPQLGCYNAFFNFFDGRGNTKCLVNPHITDLSETELVQYPEMCGSYHNHVFRDILRPRVITISAIDFYSQKRISITGTGWLARMFAHEMDHLSGILPTDHYDKTTKDEFDKTWKKNTSR